jgi:hypothetical protein
MKSAVRLILLACVLLQAVSAVADNPDFSGSYTLTGGDRRADAQKATVVTITVVQTPSDLEITNVRDGQKMVNRVTLNGKSGVFNNLHGPLGTCKAHIKDKTLILEISWAEHIESRTLIYDEEKKVRVARVSVTKRTGAQRRKG